jgi:hypothetical protein
MKNLFFILLSAMFFSCEDDRLPFDIETIERDVVVVNCFDPIRGYSSFTVNFPYDGYKFQVGRSTERFDCPYEVGDTIKDVKIVVETYFSKGGKAGYEKRFKILNL